MKGKLAHTHLYTELLKRFLYQGLSFSDCTVKVSKGNKVWLVSEIENTYAGHTVAVWRIVTILLRIMFTNNHWRIFFFSLNNTSETRLSIWNIYIYTKCPRRNGQNFGRVFLMLKYNDITQNTYIQSWTVTEIMAREIWTLTTVTHLLITKFILKLAGICGFCNANICT